MAPGSVRLGGSWVASCSPSLGRVGIGDPQAGQDRALEAFHVLGLVVGPRGRSRARCSTPCTTRCCRWSASVLPCSAASRGADAVGQGDVAQMGRAVSAAGKDSTLVGLSLPRKRAFRSRTRRVVGQQDGHVALDSRPRGRAPPAPRRATSGLGVRQGLGPGRVLDLDVDHTGPPALGRVGVVGAHDALDQRVADHVLGREAGDADALRRPPGCPRRGPGRNRAGSSRSICVGSPVTTMRAPSPRRVSTIFICRREAFWASSTMTKAWLSVRPRMKAMGATSISPFSRRRRSCSAPRMSVSASQIGRHVGIDLLVQVAGQEAQPLAGLDGRAGDDQPVDLAAQQQARAVGHGQEGLAGAGRADAEDQLAAAQQRPDSGPGRRSWARPGRGGRPAGRAAGRRGRRRAGASRPMATRTSASVTSAPGRRARRGLRRPAWPAPGRLASPLQRHARRPASRSAPRRRPRSGRRGGCWAPATARSGGVGQGEEFGRAAHAASGRLPAEPGRRPGCSGRRPRSAPERSGRSDRSGAVDVDRLQIGAAADHLAGDGGPASRTAPAGSRPTWAALKARLLLVQQGLQAGQPLAP